ncbi:HprK-related kinase A [Sphingopyxis terrae]|uniref:Hpr(Ser) kinase/phosphatase n=1 Tax=Sphingopyxis terrae subsp. ummariensis TaxID=429001 RepID=A0A1Y6EC42_9SPHN|nr:HprK-related kinase A [Sphingopyxis terrae]PCF93031.1 HprK-related kinase A [Sphingopyxis terrae subsp. ummariensis]SMQ60124.1 Hpr(Ser) kinase/phosphatase [Sphingopyxis terrae subsp. ummariensis]
MRHSTRIAVGPVQFRIGSDWRAPIDALDRLYAGHPKDMARPADATVRLFAARPWRRWLRPSVHIGGDFIVPDALPLPLSMGLLAAEMGMNLQVALGWRRHMLLHASAVARDGRAVILSGESGSGKSTLAALLGEGAWRLMGDEFTLIEPASGDALGFPRAVSLKNAAIAEIAARVDPARLGPLLAGTPKGDIRHLIPRADAIAGMHEPARPALILFPRFGGAAAIEPMAPGEVFVRLTEASTNYVALGEAGFAALARLVRETPAFGISYPDSAAGMALVEQLWAEAVR